MTQMEIYTTWRGTFVAAVRPGRFLWLNQDLTIEVSQYAPRADMLRPQTTPEDDAKVRPLFEAHEANS